MVDIDAASPAPRPGPQFEIAQIRDIMRRNDIEPFRPNPFPVRRILILLVGKLARQ